MLAPVRAKKNLPQLLAGFDVSGIPDCEVAGAAMDSRDVCAGDLFLACAGARTHGLAHAPAAVSAGAAAVAWEPADGVAPPTLDVPQVAVPALGRRAGRIAARLFDAPSERLFLAGVTGTDGKTSCAWLIAGALSALDADCGYLGTLGYGRLEDLAPATHTTPDPVRLQSWLARLAASGASAAALEVSSHALAQYRTEAVAFDVAVLTQIGRDHLDYHGDMAAYIAAKRRLFDTAGLSAVVLNADDATGREWLAAPPDGVRRIAYGRSAAVAGHAAYVRLAGIDARPDGLILDVETHAGAGRVHSRLIGTFNAHNLAATLGVLLARGTPLAQALDALSGLPTVPGRMERVHGRANRPLVIVDYAHTAGALEAALTALRAHVAGRLLCVFGCGGDRDRGKRALMGAVAARRADRIWITDDNPRSEAPGRIVADILEGVPDTVTAAGRCVIEHERDRAIRCAIAAAGAGDAVLIAGKGHESTQQYATERHCFDDRVAARRALESA